MEKMITLDFGFKKNSLAHGKFLVDCLETVPDIQIKDVIAFHHFDASLIFLSVDAPEELATLLKLRYGSFLKTRKPIEKDVSTEDFIKQKPYSYDKLYEYSPKDTKEFKKEIGYYKQELDKLKKEYDDKKIETKDFYNLKMWLNNKIDDQS